MKMILKRILGFIIALAFYTLFVLWLENLWLLLGVFILIEVFFIRRINWTFWKAKKQEDRRFPLLSEFIDVLLITFFLALFIRTFIIEAYKIPSSSMGDTLIEGDYILVSKLHYGPKMPNTPLSIPFVYNTVPFTESTPSYFSFLQLPYKRLHGISSIERNDLIVFHFPAGDTIIPGQVKRDYYDHIRIRAWELQKEDFLSGRRNIPWERYLLQARNEILNRQSVIVRPVDKKEIFVKRCVAIPGDTLKISGGAVTVNNKIFASPASCQFNYIVELRSEDVSPERVLPVSSDEIVKLSALQYIVPLTEQEFKNLKKKENILAITRLTDPENYYNFRIFPHVPLFPWNEDNMGPIVIPKQGDTLRLTNDNVSIYQTIIKDYEHNDIVIENNNIYINGRISNEYVVTQNYYWVLGDNRHGSSDSRYWGFLPEDHIIGKTLTIWLSIDKNKKGWKKIRWNRTLKVPA